TGTGSGIATAKNLRTPDSGLTWLVDLITLPAMQPQGTQTPAPAIDCETGGADGGSAGDGGSGGSGTSTSTRTTTSNASGTGTEGSTSRTTSEGSTTSVT